MKVSVSLLLYVLICLEANAQIPVIDTFSCLNQPFLQSIPYIDSNYTICDTANSSNFNVIIEPSPGNIWQKGTTNKFGNTDLRDTSCAIITDTVNSYPVNNTSAFHFLFPLTSFSQVYGEDGYYLKFWHKFETDSLLDGCWFEFSSDSGLNWFPVDSFFAPPDNIYQYCNLYNRTSGPVMSFFDTLSDGRKAWSGSSNGWQYTALYFNFGLPFKPHRGYQVNSIRFVFNSDSFNTNKPGWIINDFSTGWVEHIGFGATKDLNTFNQLPVYPNPSSSGIFHISYPDNYVKGTLQIYNMFGQKIMEQALSTRLDLNAFANGIYYYKTAFDGKSYSGVLSKH